METEERFASHGRLRSSLAKVHPGFSYRAVSISNQVMYLTRFHGLEEALFEQLRKDGSAAALYDVSRNFATALWCVQGLNN